jgi:hypothetical protein
MKKGGSLVQGSRPLFIKLDEAFYFAKSEITVR